MRCAAIAACVFAVSLALGQHFPPNGTKTYTLIEGSDTTQNLVDISWTWSGGSESECDTFPELCCRNRCKGNKHFAHSACDTSCDDACKRLHQLDLQPIAEDVSRRDTVEAALRRFGVADVVEVADRVFYAVETEGHTKDFVNDPKNLVSYRSGCWNQVPCSLSVRGIKVKQCLLTATVQLYRLVTNGDKQIRSNGPSTTVTYTYLVGVPDSLHDSYTRLSCKCELLIQDEHASTGLIDGGGIQVSCTDSQGKKHDLTSGQVQMLGISVTCNDMNHGVCTIQNPMSDCEQVCIPAGWEFECTEGGGQDTCLVKDLCIPLHGLSAVSIDWRSATDPFTALLPDNPAAARTLCLNLHKPEPNGNMKYRLVPPGSIETQRCARMTNASNFTGPWDQVRLWLVTDHATLDEMSKVLAPAPTPGIYIRMMKEAVDGGALSLSEPESAKLLEPSLLAPYSIEPATLTWFVKLLLAHDKVGALKWIASNAAAYAANFAKPEPKAAADSVTTVAAVVATFGGDEGLETGVHLLLSKELEPFRDGIAKGIGMGRLSAGLCATTDERTATRLLDVIEAIKPPSARFALLNVNPGLPASVKERAAKLLKGT